MNAVNSAAQLDVSNATAEAYKERALAAGQRYLEAVDGILDEHGVVWLLDVIGPYALEDVSEQVELPIELGVRGGRRIGLRDVEYRRDPGETRHGQKRPEHEVGLAHHSSTF